MVTDINLSYISCSKEVVSFIKEEVNHNQKDWDMSLIEHAIGKHPYYDSLLAAIRKWIFKGSFDLLIMEGDFFQILLQR